MIIITGSVTARPDTFDELRALCIEHTQRSRLEPGCLSHAVHQDVENLSRLVFVEEWSDRAALAAHFAVPASRAFAKAIGKFAAGTPTLSIFEAQRVEL